MLRSGRRRALWIALCLTAVLVLVVVVVRFRSVPEPLPNSGAQVLFEDDFDGATSAAPDRSKWSEWSGCTYNDTAYYGDIKCGERSSLDGVGHLIIAGAPGVGTSISTGQHFSFVYGEASAWIKTPGAVGYWPAFWMLNADPSGKSSAPNGEIDVLETYTTFPTIYHRAVHNWNQGDLAWNSAEDPYCGNVDLSAAFHKYTVRVEPGQITFFFDGIQCGGVVTRAEGQGKPYQFGPDSTAGNWLLLTLAIGGADGQQKQVTEPAAMMVDRVEVRSL